MPSPSEKEISTKTSGSMATHNHKYPTTDSFRSSNWSPLWAQKQPPIHQTTCLLPLTCSRVLKNKVLQYRPVCVQPLHQFICIHRVGQVTLRVCCWLAGQGLHFAGPTEKPKEKKDYPPIYLGLDLWSFFWWNSEPSHWKAIINKWTFQSLHLDKRAKNPNICRNPWVLNPHISYFEGLIWKSSRPAPQGPIKSFVLISRAA